MRYDALMIQMDILEAVKAIQESLLTNSRSALIRLIHHLLMVFKEIPSEVLTISSAVQVRDNLTESFL
ncbi:hypothetical protein Gotur_032772, partial [Gossypium turneri]